MASTTLTTRSQHDTRFVHNIRLWGKEGQEALEGTHILALGCSSTVCQAIKNLVLPGAGAFTLVDDRIVKKEDAETNFFLSNEGAAAASSTVDAIVGKPIVECAKQTLMDLHRKNDETGGVDGIAICENPNAFVTKDPVQFGATYFGEKKVNVVLIAPTVVSHDTIATLTALIEGTRNAAGDLKYANVLVLVLHVSGFIGAVRMAALKDATIVRTVQATEETFDTRYSDPFPALRKWMDAHYPANVTEAERSRIPYFALAYHAIVAYNEKHNAEAFKQQQERMDRTLSAENADEKNGPSIRLVVPDNKEQWAAARECLRDSVCTVNIKGADIQVLDFQDEVFEEAEKLLSVGKGNLKNRSTPDLNSAISRAQEKIAQLVADNSGASTQRRVAVAAENLYWFIVLAIEAFKKNNNGNLPLSLEIPDFHTNTEWYRELVQIYKTESQREILEVADTVKLLLSEKLGLATDALEEEIVFEGSSSPSSSPTTAAMAATKLSQRIAQMCTEAVPHARYLAVTSYVPLSAEYALSSSSSSLLPTPPQAGCGVKLSSSPEDGLHCPCGFYIALKVAHTFASDNKGAASDGCAIGRYPGSVNDNAIYEADQRAVAAKYSSDPAQSSSPDVVDTDCNWVTSKESIMSQIEEAVRGGGGELITTSAIIGGLAAQEVIKYVQQRYIPAGSLVVYDGHASVAHTVTVSRV